MQERTVRDVASRPEISLETRHGGNMPPLPEDLNRHCCLAGELFQIRVSADPHRWRDAVGLDTEPQATPLNDAAKPLPES